MTDILDGFDELSDRLETERATQLRAVQMGVPAPDLAARANAIADRRGLPYGVVADNLDEFERQDREEGIAAVGQRNPAVGEFLADPRRMALAGDDAEGLDRLHGAVKPQGPESFFGKVVYSLFGPLMQGERGQVFSENLDDFSRVVGQSARSTLAAVNEWAAERERDMAAEAGNGNLPEQAVYSEADRAEAARRRAQAGAAAEQVVAQYPDNSLGYHAMGVGRSLPLMLGAVATRNPLIGAELIGAGTAAEQRSQALAAGATPGQATASGVAHGVLEGTLDTITLGIARWGVGPVKDALVRRFGESVATRMLARASASAPGRLALAAGEGAATEIPTTLGQMASDELILGADYTAEDYARGVRDSAIQGAGMSGGAYAATAPLRALADRAENDTLERALRSSGNADRLQGITEAAAGVRLGELSPADLEAFVSQAAGDTSVYLPVEQAQILFQSGVDVAGLVGGQEALAEQMAAGDLVIPAGKWAAAIARLPNAQELQRHARLDPDDLSPAEMESLDMDAVLAAVGPQEPAQDAASSVQAREQVQTDVMAQLVATGRYTPAQAETQAKVWGAALDRLGTLTGQDPLALYQRYMAGVQAGTVAAEPDVQTLQQGPVDLDFGGRADEELDAQYDAMPETEGGRRLDTDLVRELSPEYRADRTLSPRIHKAASAFTKARFARMLAAPVAEGRDNAVLFTAGGGGSGKSATVRNMLGDSNADIVYDGTLSNLARARADIEATLASGRHVRIVYVYRSPENSAASALSRAISSGRPVPVSVLAEAHAKAGAVVKALAEEYADDARVEIIAFDNDGEAGKAKRMPLSAVPEVNQDEAESIFRAALDEARESGALTDSLYAAFDGREADAQVGAGSSGQPQPEREGRSADTVTQDPADGGVSASGGGILARLADGIRNLFQGRQAEGTERGQISIFPDRRMAISLFENADLSTFIHESGHFFLEVYRDIAAQPDAPAVVREDFGKLLEWLGVASAEQIGTEQHEQFARGFEAYLGEGKAPSPALQSVFSQFRAWLLGIYRTLTSLNVTLTDDVRGVFDRMLAAEEEIAAAQARTGWAPLARDATEARALGLTDKQFADYQALLAAASEEAKAEVQAKLEKAHRRAQEAWWREEKAKVRAEVVAETEALPTVRALRILSGRRDAAGAPVPEALQGMKLDKAALVEVYGEELLAKLGRVYTLDGGVDQDTAAALLGFSSGDALVQSLWTVQQTLAGVDAQVEARMRERHGDLMTDGTLPGEALDAIHNNKRVQVLERELALLAQLAGQPRISARELTATARQQVQNKTLRELRPNQYLAQERRAANEATKAAARSDYAAALQAKRQQAYNAALFRAALDAQKRAESATAYLRKAASDKTRERIGKQAGKHYVDALDAIFAGVEVRGVSAREVARRAALRDWVRRMQDDGNNTAVPESLLARVESERVTNIADMTVTDVQALREAVENLLHLARVKNRLLTAKGERDWEQAKADLVERLEKQAPKHGRGGISSGDRGKMDLARDYYAAGANWVLQPETLVEWLDGGTSGPFHDLLWEPSEAAEHTRERLNRMVGEKLQAALESLPAVERKALDRRYRIESLDADVSGHSILSALLNMGNAGNRDKLLRGGRVVGDEILPFTEVQLAEMFSKLSARQAGLVQGVWDAIDQLWPEIVKLEETLNGIAPERIQAQPFTAITKDGQVGLRGGYYPAMYDPAGARVGQFAEDEQAKKVLAGQTPVRATTSKGHTEKRTEFVAPLLLDYHAVLTRHLDGVIGDIAYRQFLQQAFKVLGDADVRRMIDNRVGPGAAKGLQKAFERGATGNFSLAGPLFGPFQKAADATMTNLSSAALGFRVPLALANVVTAPILASARVKKRFLVQGFADYYGGGPNIIANMRNNARAIHALSPMMLKRSEARSVELASIIANLRGKKGLRAKMIELSMSVHQWIVPLAENAIWLSAYKQAQAGGADITESVRQADKAIRQTQTKHTAKDLAAAEGGYMRPLMMFAGPLVIINNRLQESGLRGLKGDVRNWQQALGVWIAMAAGGSWVFELMMGRGADDEDDDGEVGFGDWMQWAATKVALMPFSAFPVIRDAAGYLDQGYARPMPLVDGMKSVIDFGKEAGEQTFGDEELDPGALTTKAVKAAGTVTGIPSNQALRSGQYLMAVGAGEHTPENPAAEAYYLMQGPPDDE